MAETTTHRGYLASTLGCRCPRCREGKLFKNPLTIGFKRNMEMYPQCPVCGQPTEIESIATLVAWLVLIGMSTDDNRFVYWLISNAVLLISLQPWLMRLSRSIWISWFVKFDKNWRENKPVDVSERINPDQVNNW